MLFEGIILTPAHSSTFCNDCVHVISTANEKYGKSKVIEHEIDPSLHHHLISFCGDLARFWSVDKDIERLWRSTGFAQ